MKQKFVLLALVLFSFILQTHAQTKVSTAQQSYRPELLQAQKACPVLLLSDTLFYIDTNFAIFTAEERAENITKRLNRIYEESDTIQIQLFHAESSIELSCCEFFIMTVLESDTIGKNMNVEELADFYAEKITTSFMKAKKDRSVWTFILRIFLVILVLGIIWFILKLINKGYVLLYRLIINKQDQFLQDLSYKDYTFITADQELKVVIWLLKAFKWIVIILLIYMLLPIIFSIFPFSRSWATALFDIVWNPFKSMLISVWNYIPQLFTIIVIFLVFKYLIRFIRYIFSEIEANKLKIAGFHKDWAQPTFNIIRFLLYAFMFVLIFPYLPGSDSRVFQGVSVFLGILVSLGSSSAIGNVVAGLVITYMRPFQVGDRIKIGDVNGDVVEKTMLVTRLKTSNNEYVTIPNSAVLSGNTLNYSTVAKKEGLILTTDITVSYKEPWQNVHEALLEAADRTSKLMKNKKHFVLQHAFGDYSVVYQLNVYTAESNSQASIYSELHQHIQDVCAERNIEIVTPQYMVNRAEE